MKNLKNIPWDLVLSALKGQASSEQERQLSMWLESSASNRQLYEELVLMWTSIIQMDDYEADVESALETMKHETIEKFNNERKKRNRAFVKRLLVGVCTAAAAAACFFFGLSFEQNKSYDDLQIVSYGVERGNSRLTLSDGSVVCLRNSSDLSLLSGSREVVLEGEGYFHVAKHDGKPFVVRTGNVEIMVYGTKFNVRPDLESDDVIVSLVEGSVSLNSGERTQMMVPGDVVRCSPEGTFHVSKEGLQSENCWIRKSLPLKGLNLGEICKCLSRWYNVSIHVDSAIGGMFNYNFKLESESLDDILAMMKIVSPISYNYMLDGSVHISKSND